MYFSFDDDNSEEATVAEAGPPHVQHLPSAGEYDNYYNQEHNNYEPPRLSDTNVQSHDVQSHDVQSHDAQTRGSH